MTFVSCGRSFISMPPPSESRKMSSQAMLPAMTPRNMYFRATSFSSGAP